MDSAPVPPVSLPEPPEGYVAVPVVPVPGEVRFLPRLLAEVPGLFEVPVARRPPGVEFVYFLCHEGASPPGHPPALVVDYVGKTGSLGWRLADHAKKREREGLPPVARLYATAVPNARAGAVEEALIRAEAPLYNRPRRTGLRPSDIATLRAWGMDVSGLVPTPPVGAVRVEL